MQVKAMNQSSGQVNAVSGKPHSKGKGTAQGRNRGNKPGKPSGGSQETKVKGCFRCNYTDHMAHDPNCPARSKKCNACGEIGHSAVFCKTKERKPLTRDDEGRNNTRGRAYQLSEESATGQQDYYAFTVGVGQPTSGSEVDLKVGGVTLLAVLIDSGASCNVIDQATWDVLKKTVQCESKKSSKKLFAYGQKDPIEVIGTFVSEIVCEISGNSCAVSYTHLTLPTKRIV